jgi:valyl-tRNA synthetase
MDKYEFALVGNELYSFIWDDFCSWYIELSKAELQSEDEAVKLAAKSTLLVVLEGILKMVHPFMPFVSEEIYLSLPHTQDSINLESWPTAIPTDISNTEMEEVKRLLSMVSAVREIKAAYKLKPSAEIDVIVNDSEGNMEVVNDFISSLLNQMCRANWIAQASDEEMVVRPIVQGSIAVPLAALVNIDEEIERLKQEQSKLQQEIKRGEGMLANPNFVNKAPEAKVNAEKEKLEGYKSQFEIVTNRLNELQK